MVDNYRPISIISIIAKIVEKILKTRLSNYFETNKLLTDAQYGFRAGRSTTHALMKIVSGIVDGLEEKNHTALSLCDLSKAFDCVSHDILLKKLSFYGIRGVTLLLIDSYLSNRFQCVNVNNTTSSFKQNRFGVPQGSVLGPLLFVIYINDICNYMLPRRCILFADDTSLICSGTNIEDLTQLSNDMENQAENWFIGNKLKLNSDKTQKIVFSTTPMIQECKSVKLLGITIDDKLTWSIHVAQISGKLSSTIFLLRQLRKIVNFATLKTVYFSLFHSQISYGVILWGGSSAAIDIFRIQKKAVRIIANLEFRAHCKPYFIKLNIMSLPSLYIFEVLLEIHKNSECLTRQSDVHNYNTRNKDLIRLPYFRLTKSQKNSLNYNLYNILPALVKSLDIKSFKKKMKIYFLQNCFYSIDEYIRSIPDPTSWNILAPERF